MKKTLAILLVLAMLLSCMLTLASCGGDSGSGGGNEETSDGTVSNNGSTDNNGGTDNNGSPNNNGGSNNNNNGGNDNRVKVSGKIFAASVYSEGLAFVETDAVAGKTLCIDEDGFVVFTLDHELPKLLEEICVEFINGWACINVDDHHYMVDKTGKIVTAEEKGVTAFWPAALSEGYILAEKVEADFSSTKKTFGVMNTDFEWVIEPTEALYETLRHEYLDTLTYYEYVFAANGYYYFQNGDGYRYFNLATGEITAVCPEGLFNIEEQQGYIREMLEDFYPTLSTVKIVGKTMGTATALLTFNNFDAGKLYMSILDVGATLETEEPVLKFEPVEVDLDNILQTYYDGTNIMITSGAFFGSPDYLMTFDFEGNVLGTYNVESLAGDNVSYSVDYHDGIIVISGRYMQTIRKIAYFDNTFTPLFTIE